MTTYKVQLRYVQSSLKKKHQSDLEITNVVKMFSYILFGVSRPSLFHFLSL